MNDGGVGAALPPVPTNNSVYEDRFSHTRWNRLTDSQLGIDVTDPDGHDVGLADAVSTLLGVYKKRYSPVDGLKHILVGPLDDYNFYDGYGDEADCCLHIYPEVGGGFRFLLNDVVAQMSAEDQKDLQPQAGGRRVIECEVTPDQEYYDNPWFPKRGPSPLVGRQVGVYGTWVRDWGHKGRPEIHPCEVIWWQSGPVTDLATPGGFTRWRIIVLQDDSNRFDRNSDFDGTPHRPWSKSPRRARIWVALLAVRDRNITYEIRMDDGLRVFGWPGEDVRSIVTTNAATSLTVTKRMSRKSEVKTRLSSLSPDPNDRNLFHCMLRIDVQIGEGDRGKEGFAELSIQASSPA